MLPPPWVEEEQQLESLVLIGAIVVHHWSPEVTWHGVAFFCHIYIAIGHTCTCSGSCCTSRSTSSGSSPDNSTIVSDHRLLPTIYHACHRCGLLTRRVLRHLSGLIAAIGLAHRLGHHTLAEHFRPLIAAVEDTAKRCHGRHDVRLATRRRSRRTCRTHNVRLEFAVGTQRAMNAPHDLLLVGQTYARHAIAQSTLIGAQDVVILRSHLGIHALYQREELIRIDSIGG